MFNVSFAESLGQPAKTFEIDGMLQGDGSTSNPWIFQTSDAQSITYSPSQIAIGTCDNTQNANGDYKTQLYVLYVPTLTPPLRYLCGYPCNPDINPPNTCSLNQLCQAYAQWSFP